MSKYMDQILRLNEFFVEGKDQQRSHVLLHITEPSTPEEKAKGYFFAVCEINNATTDSIVKLQNIIDEIENSYYEISETDSENAIEPVLQKVNQTSHSLINSDIKLNCAIGVIRQNDIVFSFYGQPQMVLFYKNKNEIYQKMDLVQSNPPDDDTPTDQLFPQIIQGRISANDFLFVGSTHITDYINLDRLEKIITTRPARQSAEHIERVLSELKNGWSFGGLIINMQPAPAKTASDIRQSPIKKGGSTKSLHAFFDTEKNTANIMSPSLLPKLNEKIRAVTTPKPTDEPKEESNVRYPQAVINSTHVHQHRSEPRTKSTDIDYKKLALNTVNLLQWGAIKIAHGLLWIATLVGTVLPAIIRSLGAIFFLITNYQNRRRSIADNIRQKWSAYCLHIKRLPLITKILLLIAALTVVVFIISINYIHYHQKQEAAKKIFDDGITVIKNKKDAAESALIYNNESSAVAELQSAQQTYNDICKNNIARDEKECSTIATQLNDLAVRLRKEVVVTPKMLLDTGSLGVNFDNGQVVKVANKIIAFSSSSSIIVIYDTVSKESQTQTTTIGALSFNGAAVPKENDYGLLLYNHNKLAKFDPKDNTLRPIEITHPNENTNISSFLIYNRRLYALDAANNQIYKYDVINTGFGRGNEWIKTTGTNLTGSVSMTIDGDVFVLKQNGEILKFNAGETQSFSVQGVEPSLTSADRIWTYTDMEYLYVLDGTNKRLITLYKDGRIKQQITAKEWTRPTGMIVDEANKNAYIFDNNKLYQVDLK